MTNKRTNNFIFSGFLALAMVLVSTLSANAQQGRYVNTYSKNTVKGFIDKLERSSNTFRKDFDRYMDRSNLNGTDTEDRYNRIVGDYEDSLDRLRSRFNRWSTWWEARADVEDMLRDAEPVNGIIVGLPFSRNIESQWRNMRNDINKVADTFDLPGLNGGGWDGGGGWNGGGSTPPSWAQGTYYSTNPAINLTIDRSGQVTVNRDGRTFNGSYSSGGFFLNNHNHTVTRRGTGLRTYNQTTGETVDFIRGTGGWGGGDTTPSWAQGSFYSNNPRITLTIDRSGAVTVVRDGRTYYGNYSGDSFVLNNDNHVVTSTSNGLRTYNQNTGERVDFRRGTGGGDGGSGNMPPSWSQGTFYSRNPQVTLTIDRDGRVTVFRGGQTYYGTYSGESFILNNHNHSVTRRGSGIRTYNQTTGETVDFTRNQ